MSYAKIIYWLTIVLAIAFSNQQFVYTHLDTSLQFNTIASPPVRIPVNLGANFVKTQNYTIWGWFKPTLKFPMISNIITLRNLIGSESFIRQEFRSSYPDCPLSQEQLAQDQNLLNLDAIRQNPNCFQEKLVDGKLEDLLFINYDLHPKSLDQNGYEIQTFDLVFVFRDGKESMRLEAFQNILKTDSWVYWAISADYLIGEVTMYMKTFDGLTEPQIKTIQVIYSDFQLKQNAMLIVADVQNNQYFDQVAGFVGKIAFIEIARYYTDSLSFLWIGFASPQSQQYNSVLIDFLFDVYDDKQTLQNYGNIPQKQFNIQGNYVPVYMINSNLLGVRFLNKSMIVIDDLNLSQPNSDIKTVLFFLNFSYVENLPNKYILIQRGNKGSSGFIEISLVLRGNGRVIQIDADDELDPKQNAIIFTSTNNLKPETTYFILVGLTQNLGKTLRVIYIDNQGGNNFDVLKENSDFNFGPMPIILFQQPQNINYQGYIELYRFIVMDSGSPAINYFNKYSIPPLTTQIQNSQYPQDRLCQVRTNYYSFSNLRTEEGNCLVCDPNSSIVNLNRMCSSYCPIGTKNAMVNNCQPCVVNTINNDTGEENYCRELNLTRWEYVPIDDDTFKLVPTRRILTPYIDYPNLFYVYVDGRPRNQKLIEYKVTSDPESQAAIFDIKFLDNLKGEKLKIDVLGNTFRDPELEPLYDQNRNLLTQNNTGTTTVLGDELVRVCYVGDNTIHAMKALAWVILALYVFTFVLLLLFSILCWSKYRYGTLSGLWKFFLHMWMKLQMVAFFMVLAIYMPCCVREFLRQLYRISVSWDHALRVWVDNSNEDSHDYQVGINKPMPEQMRQVHIRPFILHNMLIFFIVQLVILVLWIFMKVWDRFRSVKQSFMFTILNFVEYTLLILGYIVVLMQSSVFSSLNVRLSEWQHSYFVCCFLISICYWIVFIPFWCWCFFRLLGSDSFWVGTNNGNKYFYFFAGYKDSKMARIYDLLFIMVHFIVGLMIGFLIYHGLTQMIIITIFVVLLFFALLIIRPWKSLWLNIADIISQMCILVAVIFFLVYAILDHGSCVACGDREGRLCWIIVMFLWLGLLIGLILLWLAAILGFYQKKIPEEVKVENYYHKNKEVIYNQINREEHYEENNVNIKSNQMINENQEYRNNQFMVEKQNRLISENHISLNGNKNSFNNDLTAINMQEAVMAQPDEIDDDSIQEQILDVMGPDLEDEYSFDQDDYSPSQRTFDRRDYSNISKN